MCFHFWKAVNVLTVALRTRLKSRPARSNYALKTFVESDFCDFDSLLSSNHSGKMLKMQTVCSKVWSPRSAYLR